MTQESLAEAIEATPGGISQLENGLINYTQPTLEAIARALNCTPANLLSGPPTDVDTDFRRALLEYGIREVDIPQALRAIAGFRDVERLSRSDQPDDQSERASRHRVSTP